MLTATKNQPDNFEEILQAKAQSGKYLMEIIMSIRKISTTLPQIFCKMIFNYKDIVKSIIDPDDNFLGKVTS